MKVLTVIEQFAHEGVSYVKGQVIRDIHLIEHLIGLGDHAQHFVVAEHADVAPPADPAPAADQGAPAGDPPADPPQAAAPAKGKAS